MNVPNPRRDLTAASREEGAVLLVVLLCIVVFTAISSVLMTSSVTASRATRNANNEILSQIVAEEGLSIAHWELGEGTDLGKDGEGNVTATTTQGTYVVTATDIGGGEYELTAIGTAGETSTTIAQTVRVSGGSGNASPITVIGNMTDIPQWLFSGTTNMILDGGPTPAVVISHGGTYSETHDNFKSGFSDGYLSTGDISGGGQSGLNALHEEPSGEGAAIYTDLYTDMESYWSSVYGSASGRPGISSVTVWGTPATPVTYRFGSNETLGGGDKITGYGTLIMPEGFEIDSGAEIDWTGNIVILGRKGNDANFLVKENAKLSVTGNLIVVGDGGRDVMVETKPNSKIYVDGAFVSLSDTTDSGTKEQFLIEGSLSIDGLLTLGSPIHQIEFKGGSDFRLDGSMQLQTPGKQLQFKVEDDLEIVYDLDEINEALTGLAAAVPPLKMPGGAGIGAGSLEVFGWRIVSP